MPAILAPDDFLNQAHDLKSQALALVTSEDVCAEDLTKAEKMMADAEDFVAKSQKLNELKSRANEINIPEDRRIHFDEEEGKAGAWKGHFGNFLTAVKGAAKGHDHPDLVFFNSENPGQRKDLAEGAGATGGYLVPTEFRATLLSAIAEQSIVRSRAMVIPMARRSLEVPALKQDGTTAGQPHWFGGMLAFWESEAAAMTETEPAFRNINLTAHELTAVTHASNNLLADSAMSLSAILTGPRGFPGVVAWKEDYAFIRGTGAGQPLGILNAGATIAVARTTAGQVKFDDLANMIEKALPSNNLVWVAHTTMKSKLLLMAGPAATNYAGFYLWGNAEKGLPDSLMGYPIVYSEKASTLGTAGDLILADFSHYYIGDRQATTIDSTDQARWLQNQTSWKVVHRVDGQPWLNAPFTLSDGSTTISPFVILSDAA